MANRGQPGEAFEQAQKGRVRVQTERGRIAGRNADDSSELPPSPVQAETCLWAELFLYFLIKFTGVTMVSKIS